MSATPTWVTNRMASNECPPKAKKLSSTLTEEALSSRAIVSATTRSVSVSGATKADAETMESPEGTGKACRLILPFGSSGIDSSPMKCCGSM